MLQEITSKVINYIQDIPHNVTFFWSYEEEVPIDNVLVMKGTVPIIPEFIAYEIHSCIMITLQYIVETLINI